MRHTARKGRAGWIRHKFRADDPGNFPQRHTDDNTTIHNRPPRAVAYRTA